MAEAVGDDGADGVSEDLAWVRGKAQFVEQNARRGRISLFLNVPRDEKCLGLNRSTKRRF